MGVGASVATVAWTWAITWARAVARLRISAIAWLRVTAAVTWLRVARLRVSLLVALRLRRIASARPCLLRIGRLLAATGFAEQFS